MKQYKANTAAKFTTAVSIFPGIIPKNAVSICHVITKQIKNN
jgi:hypothetical protein